MKYKPKFLRGTNTDTNLEADPGFHVWPNKPSKMEIFLGSIVWPCNVFFSSVMFCCPFTACFTKPWDSRREGLHLRLSKELPIEAPWLSLRLCVSQKWHQQFVHPCVPKCLTYPKTVSKYRSGWRIAQNSKWNDPNATTKKGFVNAFER